MLLGSGGKVSGDSFCSDEVALVFLGFTLAADVGLGAALVEFAMTALSCAVGDQETYIKFITPFLFSNIGRSNWACEVYWVCDMLVFLPERTVAEHLLD